MFDEHDVFAPVSNVSLSVPRYPDWRFSAGFLTQKFYTNVSLDVTVVFGSKNYERNL
jgi:hypothetical protein